MSGIGQPSLPPRVIHEAPGRPVVVVIRGEEFALEDDDAAQLMIDIGRRYAVAAAGRIERIPVGRGRTWDDVNMLQALALIEDLAHAVRINLSARKQ